MQAGRQRRSAPVPTVIETRRQRRSAVGLLPAYESHQTRGVIPPSPPRSRPRKFRKYRRPARNVRSSIQRATGLALSTSLAAPRVSAETSCARFCPDGRPPGRRSAAMTPQIRSDPAAQPRSLPSGTSAGEQLPNSERRPEQARPAHAPPPWRPALKPDRAQDVSAETFLMKI